MSGHRKWSEIKRSKGVPLERSPEARAEIDRVLDAFASEDPQRADPTLWPFMPLNPLPLLETPPVGGWVWRIPDRVRHSSFHRVAGAEAIDDDDARIELVLTSCRNAWPLNEFAAVVSEADPVLERIAHGSNAACRKCLDGGRTRRTRWMTLVESQRSPRLPLATVQPPYD